MAGGLALGAQERTAEAPPFQAAAASALCPCPPDRALRQSLNPPNPQVERVSALLPGPAQIEVSAPRVIAVAGAQKYALAVIGQFEGVLASDDGANPDPASRGAARECTAPPPVTAAAAAPEGPAAAELTPQVLQAADAVTAAPEAVPQAAPEAAPEAVPEAAPAAPAAPSEDPVSKLLVGMGAAPKKDAAAAAPAQQPAAAAGEAATAAAAEPVAAGAPLADKLVGTMVAGAEAPPAAAEPQPEPVVAAQAPAVEAATGAAATVQAEPAAGAGAAPLGEAPMSGARRRIMAVQAGGAAIWAAAAHATPRLGGWPAAPSLLVSAAAVMASLAAAFAFALLKRAVAEERTAADPLQWLPTPEPSFSARSLRSLSRLLSPRSFSRRASSPTLLKPAARSSGALASLGAEEGSPQHTDARCARDQGPAAFAGAAVALARGSAPCSGAVADGAPSTDGALGRLWCQRSWSEAALSELLRGPNSGLLEATHSAPLQSIDCGAEGQCSGSGAGPRRQPAPPAPAAGEPLGSFSLRGSNSGDRGPPLPLSRPPLLPGDGLR